MKKKKNIVALIAGIVLIFGAITAPAFAEDIDLGDPDVQASQQAELIKLMGNPPIPRPDYCPDAPAPCAGVEDQYINEGKPVEDPLIGEDGTFTDEAKAEQIDTLVQNAPPAPAKSEKAPRKNVWVNRDNGAPRVSSPTLPHTGD